MAQVREGRGIWFAVAAGALCLLSLAGCSTVSAPERDFARQAELWPGKIAYVAGVPDLRPSRDDVRAAASLASVASFWGQPIDVHQATALLRSVPSASPEEALVLAGERAGLWSFSMRGSLEDVKEKLRGGVPVITLLQDGTSAADRRFSVLVGYDDMTGDLIAHDGLRQAAVRKQDEFGRRWLPGGRWYAILCPAQTSCWSFTIADLVSRAGYLLRKGDPAAAARDYESAIRMQPGNLALRTGFASCLQQAGQDEAAIAAYREVRRLDPRHFASMNNLAFLLARSGGSLQEAEALAREALTLSPEHPEALDTLGYVLLRAGRHDDAIAVLRRAMAVASKLPPASRRAVEVHLALAYLGNQNEEMVRKIVDAIMTEDPSFSLPAELGGKRKPAAP